jgi:hypothetical protein
MVGGKQQDRPHGAPGSSAPSLSALRGTSRVRARPPCSPHVIATLARTCRHDHNP